MSPYRSAVERYKGQTREQLERQLVQIKAKREDLDRQQAAIRRAQKEMRRECASVVVPVSRHPSTTP